MEGGDRKHIGEGANPDAKFKGNSNLGKTGGVVPFDVQYGHGKKPGGAQNESHAKSHTAGS